MDVDVSVSLLLLLIFIVVSFSLLCSYLLVQSTPEASLIRHDKEKTFLDPANSNAKSPFADLNDRGSVELSVIIPAYEEQVRLPKMLEECLEYLENRQKENRIFTFEVIIVDDGSKDDTTKIGLKYVEKFGINKVRVMTLVHNRGKGGAVKLGMYGSRGKYLLFADADGATKFSDLDKLEENMKKLVSNPEGESAIVVGSRAHLEKEAIAQRSLFRTILMYGFHFLVWLFCVQGVRDTQCGFKLLTRRAARLCFSNLHIERWAFDVELLYIAQHLKIVIHEVAVNWTEIEGSKVEPFWSWLQMGRDLGLIWLRYRIGAWRIKEKHKDD